MTDGLGVDMVFVANPPVWRQSVSQLKRPKAPPRTLKVHGSPWEMNVFAWFLELPNGTPMWIKSVGTGVRCSASPGHWSDAASPRLEDERKIKNLPTISASTLSPTQPKSNQVIVLASWQPLYAGFQEKNMWTRTEKGRSCFNSYSQHIIIEPQKGFTQKEFLLQTTAF